MFISPTTCIIISCELSLLLCLAADLRSRTFVLLLCFLHSLKTRLPILFSIKTVFYFKVLKRIGRLKDIVITTYNQFVTHSKLFLPEPIIVLAVLRWPVYLSNVSLLIAIGIFNCVFLILIF